MRVMRGLVAPSHLAGIPALCEEAIFSADIAECRPLCGVFRERGVVATYGRGAGCGKGVRSIIAIPSPSCPVEELR